MMVSRVANQLYEQNLILANELDKQNKKLEDIEYAIKKLTEAVNDVAYVLDNK